MVHLGTIPSKLGNRFLYTQKHNLLSPKKPKSKKCLHAYKTLLNPNPFPGDLLFKVPHFRKRKINPQGADVRGSPPNHPPKHKKKKIPLGGLGGVE